MDAIVAANTAYPEWLPRDGEPALRQGDGIKVYPGARTATLEAGGGCEEGAEVGDSGDFDRPVRGPLPPAHARGIFVVRSQGEGQIRETECPDLKKFTVEVEYMTVYGERVGG